jgi:hypothetical protein
MLINMTFSYPTRPGKNQTREMDLELSNPAGLIDSSIFLILDTFGHPAWFGPHTKVTQGTTNLASKLPPQD